MIKDMSIGPMKLKGVFGIFKFKNAKDTFKLHRSNIHVVDHDSDCSDDVGKEVYAAEFVWPSKAKESTCPSLKPIQKNR